MVVFIYHRTSSSFLYDSVKYDLVCLHLGNTVAYILIFHFFFMPPIYGGPQAVVLACADLFWDQGDALASKSRIEGCGKPGICT